MLSVGLTGGIASGKTAVADEFGRLGAVIVDSDVVAREVVEPGTPGLAAVIARFGGGVLQPSGALDRQALGQIVFADEQARADLNAIVHPLVRQRARELAAAAPPESIVVQVIPLLVETGQGASFDEVVVVDVTPSVQLERLMQRDHSTREAALARIAAQTSRPARLAAATIVIENNGDRAALLTRTQQVWDQLVAKSVHS